MAALVILLAWPAVASALPIETGDVAPSGAEALQPEVLAPYQANQDLAEALRLIEQGQLAPARLKVEGFLQQHPDSAPGQEVLGIALVLQGKIDDGLNHLQRAIQINPNQSTAITKVGDVYLARGEIAQAKAQFQQAIALNPGDRFAHQRLGIICEQEGDYPQAIDQYEKGLLGTPANYLGVKVNLGRLYNRLQRFQQAIDLLTPVVTEECPDATAHLVVGTAWLGLHKPEAALASFERARKLEAKPEAAHLALGIAYREAGDLAKSREELDAALKGKPGWSAAQVQMAETLVAMDRIADAMALYTQAAQDPVGRTGIRNRMAEVYAAHKQYENAIQVYESLRKDGSANVRTYDGLATVLQFGNRLPEAEEVLREGCRKYPDNALLQFRLGMHLSLVRDYEHAIEILHQARQLAPADPRIQKAISLTELRRGNRKTAISEARQLLQLVPASTDDQFYLATLLEEDGQTAEATRQYEEVLRRSPEHVGALNNLAQLRLKANQPQAALELAERAARLAPERPVVLDTLGWVQYRCGNLREAAATLGKAVAGGPGNPTHRYHLAVLYSQLGRKADAREQLELALKAEADFPDRADAVRLAGQLRSGTAP